MGLKALIIRNGAPLKRARAALIVGKNVSDYIEKHYKKWDDR